MPRKYILILKLVTWIGCLSPLMLLVYEAVTNTLGPDPTANITFTTGYNTLLFLILSLAITPVRNLSPRLSWLIHFRRLLGLFAFFYGTIHFFTWIALYTSFDVNAMMSDILKRRYITAGMFAWLCLLPLAATSTTWSIRKLGGKRWRNLHRLAYVAAIAGVIHYWWQMKPGVLTPLRMTIALTVLLLARPVLAWWRQSRASTV